MVPPASKRRRFNDDALRKPFKSPFRSPIKPVSDSPEVLDSHVQEEPDLSSRLKSTKPNVTSPGPAINRQSAAIQKRRSLATRSRVPITLTSQITELKQTINTLEQASLLLSSDKSMRLEALIAKWRSASRSAAEELFATSRDRVNKMGGVGAWREREREKNEWQKQWDYEERKEEGSCGAEIENMEDSESRTHAYDYDGDRLEMDEREPQPQNRDSLEGNDDDSFTMDMMLKALSINLDVIGFSRELQGWEE